MHSTSLLVLGLLGACGTDGGDDGTEVDCTMETGADVFVVGLEKVGTNGVIDFKMMSATPAPPARGNNTWVFQISSMTGGVVGAPMDGATLQVTPYMPLHGHDAGVVVEISPLADPGTYELKPVNLWMPGVWETTIKATSGTTSDTTIYKFCIN